MVNSQVIVGPLTVEDCPRVRQLLIDGLTERWGTYETRFNPDIEAFPHSCQGSLVLVAKQSGQVVGTATLRFVSLYRAEIVRMSVAASNRRSGIGSAILVQMLSLAREQGIGEVFLETTSSWTSAVEFYAQHGFRKTHEHEEDSYFLHILNEA